MSSKGKKEEPRPLTKAELIRMLARVPDDAMIYVRSDGMYQQDNAYPATARAFVDNGKVTVYFEQMGIPGWHRNHPCGHGETYVYSGGGEIKLAD